MPPVEIAIVGAGAIGQALTVDLARRSFVVPVLVESAPDKVAALRRAGRIELSGHMGAASVPLPALDTDAAAAAACRVVIVATTVDCHAEVARGLAPVLGNDHIVLLANGYADGSARFAAALRQAGCATEPAILELNSTPYLVCSPQPGQVHVTARKQWMELTSYRPEAARRHQRLVAELIPGVEVGDNALASSLNNQNPIAHVPSYLMNAALARHSEPVAADATRGGAFYLDDYSGDEVLRLRTAADAERMAVMQALGFGDYVISRPDFARRCYGPHSREAVAPRMGRTFARRFVTEDVPFGLVPIENFGRKLGVGTPVISSMVTLVGLLESQDWRAATREEGDGGWAK